MPKVSVIVPVYNAEKYLAECVHSILNQTLTDLELILVDDGSADASPALCDGFARRDGRVPGDPQAQWAGCIRPECGTADCTGRVCGICGRR